MSPESPALRIRMARRVWYLAAMMKQTTSDICIRSARCRAGWRVGGIWRSAGIFGYSVDKCHLSSFCGDALWRRSVEPMKQCMRIFTVCQFCKFVFSLQCNKLGWNFKFITCTRPLFFQCFHCNCIVENCGMFLEKKVINLIVAFWKLLWKFSLYSQYLYILSLSLSVSLFSWTMPPDLGLVHPEPST